MKNSLFFIIIVENQFASDSCETTAGALQEKSRQDREREEQESSLRAYLEDFLGVIAPAPPPPQHLLLPIGAEADGAGAETEGADADEDFDENVDEIDPAIFQADPIGLLGREPGEILEKPSSSAHGSAGSPKKPILIQAELKGKRGRVTIQVTQGGPEEKKQRMLLMRSGPDRQPGSDWPPGAGSNRQSGSGSDWPPGAGSNRQSGAGSDWQPGAGSNRQPGAGRQPGAAAGSGAAEEAADADERDRYSLRKRKS